jgi:hypothetical protein
MKFLIGPYMLQLPYWCKVKAEPFIPPVDNFGEGSTIWELIFEPFIFRIHLDPRGKPQDLGSFILSCTKQYVDLTPVEINGIGGVTYGGYGEPGGCWIDWWMKQGETMICISLQGKAVASDADRQTHQQVVGSLTHVAT